MLCLPGALHNFSGEIKRNPILFSSIQGKDAVARPFSLSFTEDFLCATHSAPWGRRCCPLGREENWGSIKRTSASKLLGICDVSLRSPPSLKQFHSLFSSTGEDTSPTCVSLWRVLPGSKQSLRRTLIQPHRFSVNMWPVSKCWGSSLKSQEINCICPQTVPKAVWRSLGKISPPLWATLWARGVTIHLDASCSGSPWS